MGRVAEDPATRFWSKVRKTEGCWIWTAYKDPAGYGRFMRGKRPVRAHRFSYELVHGAIPSGRGYHGTCVLHRCDNPACVRPDHLFAGSQAENNADKARKGRTCPPRGETHKQAKLTTHQVAQVRRDVGAGQTKVAVARKFGVSDTLVGYIVRGQARATG